MTLLLFLQLHTASIPDVGSDVPYQWISLFNILLCYSEMHMTGISCLSSCQIGDRQILMISVNVIVEALLSTKPILQSVSQNIRKLGSLLLRVF
jgi:hypothetical protein